MVATALFCPGYFWVMDRLSLRLAGSWTTAALDGAMHIGFLFALVLFLENGGEALTDGWAAALWRHLPPAAQQTLEGWFGPQAFAGP